MNDIKQINFKTVTAGASTLAFGGIGVFFSKPISCL